MAAVQRYDLRMTKNCVEIDEIASVRLGLTRVQQSVRSEWRIQDESQLLSKNVPFWSVPIHIVETSGWNNITFGSQGNGIIHSFSDFDLGMSPCDLQLRGGGIQQEDHLASN